MKVNGGPNEDDFVGNARRKRSVTSKSTLENLVVTPTHLERYQNTSSAQRLAAKWAGQRSRPLYYLGRALRGVGLKYVLECGSQNVEVGAMHEEGQVACQTT